MAANKLKKKTLLLKADEVKRFNDLFSLLIQIDKRATKPNYEKQNK